MIIQPKVRGFICTTAHPLGCAQNVKNQIDYVKRQPSLKNGPKKALIIGSSTGYGLASRIVTAFGAKAATIGVFFEKEAENKRTATTGLYNSLAFEKFAKQEGLYAQNFNGDAFSDEMRQKVIAVIKEDLGQVDLVVYSLAAPRRTDPKTSKVYKAVLKPIDIPYTNKSIDLDKNEVVTVTLPAASQDEIDQTVAVMGGEDWELWMNALSNANFLAKGVLTVAYSYIGPEITNAVYRKGTIGAAKDHLEATARQLNKKLKAVQGRALVSVNKAIVTQSSSAIPFIPLYFIILAKVMKEKGLHEDSIEQMYRLFATKLYTGKPIEVDEGGRVRVDDWETREDVQAIVNKLWQQVDSNNLKEISDLEGYQEDFLRLFGFGIPGVDYKADVDPTGQVMGIEGLKKI